MNIFVLHRNPKKCAKYHCDKHVVKMILETAQLLYTCLWLTLENPELVICNAPENKSGNKGYKKCHDNHPCNIWLRESSENYKWLCELGIELCNQYEIRYNKVHSTRKHIEWLLEQKPNIENIGLTQFKLAMPEIYKEEDELYYS